VAEIVFAMVGVGNFIPTKVDAASGAGFADSREKIHDRCRLDYKEKIDCNKFGCRVLADLLTRHPVGEMLIRVRDGES
jgi:hypothetical protein